jgi:hypothetical protein
LNQPPHQEFEQQIERIHRLLEDDDAKITWNDRILDPDSPNKTRQVDITIRRGGFLTLIECRLHQNPQDVTWIEELIGRRISLKADALIAVSSSGFSETAKNKAKSHGIILRDIRSVAAEEILDWTRKITVHFCEFSKVTLKIYVSLQSFPPVLTERNGNRLSRASWISIFQTIRDGLDKEKWKGERVKIRAKVAAEILVSGRPPLAIEFYATVKRRSEQVLLASIVSYSDPVTGIAEAKVGRFQQGKTELIEKDNRIFAVFDISQIKIPRDCIFETIMLDAGVPVALKGAQFIGLNKVLEYTGDIHIEFCMV